MKKVLQNNILIIEGRKTLPPLLIDQIMQFDFKQIYSISPEHALERISDKRINFIFYRIEELFGENEKVINNILIFFPGIPVVLVSRKNEPEMMRRAIKLGVHDFLQEPFELDEIPAVIARNIERQKITIQNLQKKQNEMLLKAIEALITAMEAKDRYTSGHSKRVVEYAIMMAKKIDLNPTDRFLLQLSAALHDIGKIGLPDEILNKASSLRDIEYNIVREHPLIGSKIVSKIDELKDVSRIIKHHHERYDGTGYPDKLKGKKIPLLSRILTIVDAYESLVSDRVYRKRIKHDQAINELQRGAGTHFDPELVKVFIKEINLDTIRKNEEARIRY